MYCVSGLSSILQAQRRQSSIVSADCPILLASSLLYIFLSSSDSMYDSASECCFWQLMKTLLGGGWCFSMAQSFSSDLIAPINKIETEQQRDSTTSSLGFWRSTDTNMNLVLIYFCFFFRFSFIVYVFGGGIWLSLFQSIESATAGIMLAEHYFIQFFGFPNEGSYSPEFLLLLLWTEYAEMLFGNILVTRSSNVWKSLWCLKTYLWKISRQVLEHI